MKKRRFIAVVLVLVLLLPIFSGCAQKKPEPLRICVDAYIDDNWGSRAEDNLYEPVETQMELLLERLEKAGGPTDIVVEYIPHYGAERETAIDRLRVEIGSGGGPDVFILSCDAKFSMGHDAEALFLMPEKTMNLGYFLPLDEYMENNTQYAEWDQMNRVVLEAGKNEEGQQIIPLAYTFPICTYRQWEATHVPDKTLTWNDMLTSDDINLRAAAVWTDNTSENYDGCPFIFSRDALPEYILGDIVDFSTEQLSFTEEELGVCMEEIFDLGTRFKAGEFAEASTHYNELIGHSYNRNVRMIDMDGSTYESHCGIADNTDATMIPLYSNDGGVTATITSFAAINRNTSRPEDAYAFLDFLLSKEIQQSCGIFDYLYFYSRSVPMHNELMNGQENCLYEWQTHNRSNPDLRNLAWYMKPVNFEAYAAAREQITRARFRDVMDVEFDRLYWDLHRAKLFDTGDTEEIISHAYETMQRMVRE